MCHYGTCLFDLDGTLINSIELIMESFRYALRINLDIDPTEEQELRWRAGFGTPLRTQLAKFTSPEQVDGLVDSYRFYTHEHHDHLLRPYAGINGALEALRCEGVRLAVVTSKTHQLARRGLRQCGLNHYFDVLIGMDDVAEHKPHPAPVLAALTRLSVGVRDVVFVGDSPHDMCAGRAAGVDTAAALWGPFSRDELAAESPDHWLATPAQISTLEP